MGWNKPRKAAVQVWKVFAIFISTVSNEGGLTRVQAIESKKTRKENQQNMKIERVFFFYIYKEKNFKNLNS